MEFDRTATDEPGRREVYLGVLWGLCGLLCVALFLSVADPILRDPGGAVFSFSSVLNKAGD